MPRDKTTGRKGFIEPFTTAHLYKNPDEAVAFYQEATGNVIPAPFVEWLKEIKEWDGEVTFCVQPGFSTNYITVAREGDRRAWLYLRPEYVTIWVGNYRNLEAIVDYFDATREPKNDKSKWLRPNVIFTPENIQSETAHFALAMAAAWAVPGKDNDAGLRT
jgi:hypothetical protein